MPSNSTASVNTPYDPACGYGHPPPLEYHQTTVAITPIKIS